jgi:hypothetical protein
MISSFSGERLPSADRSRLTLNTARRHRDSAARLCSAFPNLCCRHARVAIVATARDPFATLITHVFDPWPSVYDYQYP